MSPKLLNILLALIPITLFFGYIDPVYNGGEGLLWTPEKSIPQLKTENVQYANTLNQFDLVKEAILKVSKEYKAVPPKEVEKISIMLSDTIDQVKLRNEIVSIASKQGIALNNLVVEEDKRSTKGALGSYIVTFGVRSRYPVFKKLMEKYESNMRFFIIESVSIDRQSNDENLGNVKIEDEEALNIAVSFRVHFLK